MRSPNTTNRQGPTAEQIRLLEHWSLLEKVWRAYDLAQDYVEAAIGTPLCKPDCGLCCEMNSVLALGIEAEITASYVLGKPGMLDTILDACEEWLTRPGKWTYGDGRQLNAEKWKELCDKGEFEAALRSQCPVITADKKCAVHHSRPLVCRSFGVTWMAPKICPRKLGIGEAVDKRAYYDRATNLTEYQGKPISLEGLVDKLRKKLTEPRYAREGFFYTFLYERFRADKLAGLMDDGKVPMVKMVAGYGGTHLLLWQEQYMAQWSPKKADESIAEQVPLEYDAEGPVVTVRRSQRR